MFYQNIIVAPKWNGGYARYKELTWRLKTRADDSMQHLTNATLYRTILLVNSISGPIKNRFSLMFKDW